MLDRVAIDDLARRRLERVLAQGTASRRTLSSIQLALEEEMHEPLLLIGARGERAMIDSFLDALAAQRLPVKALAPYTERLSGRQFPLAVELLLPGRWKTIRAGLLRYNTLYVEMSKLPAEQRQAALNILVREGENLPALARCLAQSDRVARGHWLAQAHLGCVVAMLAAERYRLDKVRWPTKLDDLVPVYLNSVPISPIDGQPLRLILREDGIIVSSSRDQATQEDSNVSTGAASRAIRDPSVRLRNVSLRQVTQPLKK